MHATATRITAEQLAELVLGRPTAVLVQDATGDVHPLPYLNSVQADDPDTVVLLTRDQALAALTRVATEATVNLIMEGAIQ